MTLPTLQSLFVREHQQHPLFESLDSPTLIFKTVANSSQVQHCIHVCYIKYICIHRLSQTLHSVLHAHAHACLCKYTCLEENTASVWAAASSQTKDWSSNHCFLKKHKITESEERPPVSQCPNQRVYSMCSKMCAWYAHLYVMHVNLEDTCKQGRAG